MRNSQVFTISSAAPVVTHAGILNYDEPLRALCWARKVKLINCLSNNKSTTLTNNLFLTLHLISCMDFARCPLCPARSTYWVTWCFCVMSLKMSLAMSSKTQRGVNGTYPNLHGSWGRMSNLQVHFCYKDKMLPRWPLV